MVSSLETQSLALFGMMGFPEARFVQSLHLGLVRPLAPSTGTGSGSSADPSYRV